MLDMEALTTTVIVKSDARIKTGLVKWKNQLVYGTMS